MPLPAALVPVAWKAAAGVAAAALVWSTVRAARLSEARPAEAEAALDGVEEGLEYGWARDGHRARGDARGAWRGVVRLGDHGPGVAVDFSGLARVRLARVAARRPGR